MNEAVDLDPRFIDSALAFKKNPYLFLEGALGVTTFEDYQKKVIDTFWRNDRTCVSACHDVGKTFLAARLAITFLNVFPNSKVITTAPTFNQVERILWSELRAAHAKAKIPLGGRLNMTDWTFSPDWFALGFSPRNEAGNGEMQVGSSFQGFHAPHLLLIFDEATGIPYNVWTMAEGLMTSAHVKFLAIGNPTSTASEFYQCFKSRQWAKVYLSCFDSPNLKINGINDLAALKREIEIYKSLPDVKARAHVDAYKVVRPYLLTAKWVVTQAAKWGLEHPLTVSKILGSFPTSSDKALVSLGAIEEAQLRVYYPEPSDRKILGVDVARFGADSTIITGMHGRKQTMKKDFFKHSTTEVAGEVIQASREIGGADIIVIDETGLGGGVVDFLKDEIGAALPKACEVRGVQFGAACEDEEDKEKFANLKARMFGLLREDIKSADGLALLNESIYTEELPTILYSYNRKGQMVIESKDEYKKRTGRSSPDASDSLALANYGRYDELKIGKFTNQTKTERVTNAPSLKSIRNW